MEIVFQVIKRASETRLPFFSLLSQIVKHVAEALLIGGILFLLPFAIEFPKKEL